MDEIWIYKGLRRLMPTPWIYHVPPLYYLKGEDKQKEIIAPVFIHVKPITRQPKIINNNQLF